MNFFEDDNSWAEFSDVDMEGYSDGEIDAMDAALPDDEGLPDPFPSFRSPGNREERIAKKRKRMDERREKVKRARDKMYGIMDRHTNFWASTVYETKENALLFLLSTY